MKKIISSMLLIILLCIAMSLAPPESAAAELKPMVTISFSGYDELKADLELIGKLGGKPEMGQMLEGLIAMITQGKGLGGLDQKQPLGAVMLTDGSIQFTSYGFLPVSNLDQLLELMKNPLTGEAPKAENGIYEILLGPRGPTYMAQRGNWLYVTDKKETLAAVDPIPAALLGDLPQKYLLAARASIKNIPDAYRQNLLAVMQMGMQMNMQRAPGETDTQYAARTAMTKQNIDHIKTLLNELDELFLGLKIDRQTNKAYLDLELTAKAETNLVNQLTASKPGKSDFAGLKMPSATITYNGTGPLIDADVARAKNTLNSMLASAQEELKKQELAKEQLDLAEELLNDLFAVVIKTIELKRTDMGMALLLEPTAVTFVAGSIIADGVKLEGLLKKLVAAVEKDDPDAVKFVKLNTETYQGIRFHIFSMPTPDQKTISLVGDTLDVVLGIGDDKLFVAAGRDALKTLKEAIDRSQSEAGKEIPAMQLVVSASKIAKFLSAVADDEQVQFKAVADKIAADLEQSGGKDHLTVTTQPITNGARIRLELEEGILKAITTMASVMDVIPGR